jgi:hypothetical protein
MLNYAVKKSDSSDYNLHLTTTTVITTLTNILPDLHTACKPYDYCAVQNGL